ncbi:hypothetical protein BO83DRAFT_210280 [Aspergillus eucalypticola CBS 122712]|uniref:Uncharacterized protein n=1 Tax=Aspergillus eucalypticola (strain CBS 122712 / IBT 29274) TaxID=1448314 RepID=A0A317UKD2_ASPEC|nr:uncharacterized protein BO83DRAFT_210280 [Aspergillus eucalypticola CBS 122712]PWY61799.1 hypothetical protein BO83DRAFT_210280 [Aspergillus eucalypticola CBS 122712]
MPSLYSQYSRFPNSHPCLVERSTQRGCLHSGSLICGGELVLGKSPFISKNSQSQCYCAFILLKLLTPKKSLYHILILSFPPCSALTPGLFIHLLQHQADRRYDSHWTSVIDLLQCTDLQLVLL